MLVIRREQFEALRLGREITAAIVHARKFFPRETSKMPYRKLRAHVRAALIAARRYEFGQADRFTFVDLTLLFGLDFDLHLKWATDILNASPAGARFRGSHLFRRATIELNRRETQEH